MPNRRRKSLWVLGISLLFYLIWFATDKITITPDAEGYMQGISSREPLYPSLLFLFRGIFGEGRYLRTVVLFQSVLAAAACWRLTMALTDKFNLKWFSVSVLLGVQFAVVLLCRFAAERKSTYCVSIESEGIAIPLYLLFVTELLLFFWYAEYRNMILAGVWAVCLICTRKQMFMAVPILVICYLGLWLKKIISRKKGVIALSSVAVILLVAEYASLGSKLSVQFCAAWGTYDAYKEHGFLGCNHTVLLGPRGCGADRRWGAEGTAADHPAADQ